MRFTLNTLGAPAWTIEDVARNARAYGYDGVDLRLLDGETITVQSVRANRARLAALFPAAELPIAVVATSVRVAAGEGSERQAVLDESHAWIDLAAELGVPVIRLFGARVGPALDVESSIGLAAETLAQLAEHAASAGVSLGLETHDDFSSARTVARVIADSPAPAVGAIWDMWHTTRVGESPEQVLAELGDRIVNVHLKDARRVGNDWQLVLLGEGDVPVKDSVHLLLQRGYTGYVSVEWEKKWHPELADPEVAFPQHLPLLRHYVRQSGHSA